MNIRIGLFDSGVGGFTVLKKILQFYPQFPCVYLADTARLPYGNRSQKEIREIADEVLVWLLGQDLSAIIVACNTTNSLALDILGNKTTIPVLGLIQAAASMVREKRVGVLATAATVRSKSYTREILRVRPDAFVLEQACPLFVPMVEMEEIDSDQLRKIAFDYLTPLLDARVESIVLGCSHYPLLEPLLREILPSNVRLIDPSIGLLNNLEFLIGSKIPSIQPGISIGNTSFFVTSDPSDFALKTRHWLGEYPEVNLVSLRSKACIF